MDLFKMMKQAMSLKSTMNQAQSQLASRRVEVERNGVRVSVSCDLKKISCSVSPEAAKQGHEALSRLVTAAAQEALESAGEKAAEEMKTAMGGVDPGGLADMLR